jgi:hypothetical protein
LNFLFGNYYTLKNHENQNSTINNFLLASLSLKAQNNEYSTSISDSLKENANAIVRLNQIDVTISSQRSMAINTKRVITVLNEKDFPL